MDASVKKFGIKDQIGYFLGDLGGSMSNIYIDAFYMTFCTYVLGMSPQFMAGLFLFAKIWDAINDPIMGSIPDRFTIGKSGDRFKPYIKIAMFFLASAPLICFFDVSSWDATIKSVWVCAAYIYYGMSYTAASMPYGAMAAVITDQPEERMKLSRARSIGGLSVGMIFIPLVSTVIWNNDNTPNPAGYFQMAILAAGVCLLCYVLLLALTTERVRIAPATNSSTAKSYKFMDVVKDALRNRPLLGLMLSSIGGNLAAAANGFAMYLYKEYYHAPKVMAAQTLVTLPLLFLCFTFVPKLGAKFGKRKLIVVGLIFTAVCSLGLYLFRIPNPYVFLVLNGVAGIGQTVFMILTWALVSDCIDYQDYQTGRRADGTIYSIFTFSRKVGASIASSLAAFMLGAIGFVSTNQVQAEGVGESIRSLITLIPVLACAIQLIGIGVIYNLTKEKSDEVNEVLAERRAQATESEV